MLKYKIIMQKYSFDAVIFDLDGVITQTAITHALAWKDMFDDYLREREKKHNEPFREFTHAGDYLVYVDGKPRYKGVESFLKSREYRYSFSEIRMIRLKKRHVADWETGKMKLLMQDS
jgi:beta-phosphoglucomutase-like phosphatase (HAD superfamily)